MSPEPWIMGWDLGGAHLKVALADGAGRLRRVHQGYTPLWRGLEHLDNAVKAVSADFPVRSARHRLTMTGELVDLFADRNEGVGTLSARMAGHLDGLDLGIYAGPLGFVDAAVASANGRLVASANWHATGALVAQRLATGLLVDIGSTTTDLIPVRDGAVCYRGYTDRERQGTGELVYTGLVRTPVMALAESVPLDGEWVGLAAEHFATTADLYRLTGELPAHADQGETADGRGKSVAESAARLARMVGEDADCHEPAYWRALARYLTGRQLDRIERACARQCSAGLGDDAPLVGAGIGRPVVRRLAQRLDRPYLDIDSLFDFIGGCESHRSSANAGDCAPAAAVALLSVKET